MATPSGAPPAPGPDDVSTAILRPKKSWVPISCVAWKDAIDADAFVVYSPNRLIVDEATSDDNSGMACIGKL